MFPLTEIDFRMVFELLFPNFESVCWFLDVVYSPSFINKIKWLLCGLLAFRIVLERDDFIAWTIKEFHLTDTIFAFKLGHRDLWCHSFFLCEEYLVLKASEHVELQHVFWFWQQLPVAIVIHRGGHNYVTELHDQSEVSLFIVGSFRD